MFTLTFTEFMEFDQKTSYVDLRGSYADDMTIDRVANDRGYEADNIRGITRAENSAKGWKPIDNDIEF